MKLSNEAIEEFKKIYKEEYGEELSDEEANRLGIIFLSHLLLYYKYRI